MRIPLHIVLISCLLAAIIPWYIGTRNYDFMKEPSAKEIKRISQEWTKNQRSIIASQDYGSENDEDFAEGSSNNKTALVSRAKSDLSTPPSLSEYNALGSQGSESLISLAEHFETQSSPLRALLAWERVLDATEPTTEQRDKAVKSIARLKAELPPWNTDTNADIKLILHLGTSASDTTFIKKTLSLIATSINQASSYIVSIDTKISKQVVPAKATELTPISLWFSSAENQTTETPAISINTDLKKTELLQMQLEQAIYQTLQVALAENTNFKPLAELKADDQPMLHITRLMWSELANKIK